MRGGVVTVASQAVSIGIQLTSTVVLARLLSTEDYGIIAAVMTVTAFTGLFGALSFWLFVSNFLFSAAPQ